MKKLILIIVSVVIVFAQDVVTDTETDAKWQNTGLNVAQIQEWKNQGISPENAVQWIAIGVDSQMAKKYEALSYFRDVESIAKALKLNLSYENLLSWSKALKNNPELYNNREVIKYIGLVAYEDVQKYISLEISPEMAFSLNSRNITLSQLQPYFDAGMQPINIFEFAMNGISVEKLRPLLSKNPNLNLLDFYKFRISKEYFKGKRSYTKRSENVVLDNYTGLLWQNDPSVKSNKMSFGKALGYCENLTLDGLNGWRLPTIKEIDTLVDYTRANPAINPIFHVVEEEYWNGNYPHRNRPEDNLFVRCVRGE